MTADKGVPKPGAGVTEARSLTDADLARELPERLRLLANDLENAAYIQRESGGRWFLDNGPDGDPANLRRAAAEIERLTNELARVNEIADRLADAGLGFQR